MSLLSAVCSNVAVCSRVFACPGFGFSLGGGYEKCAREVNFCASVMKNVFGRICGFGAEIL